MVDNALALLPAHLEKHLGVIAEGWSESDSSSGITVACFDNMPEQGIRSYVTMGLSRELLQLPRNRAIRQELIFSASEEFQGEAIAGFLLSLAERLSASGKAVLRGEVAGPSMPIIEGVQVCAAYFTNPTPFPSDLAKFETEDEPVIFVLVIPLTKPEVLSIAEKGWNRFEDELELQNPDIWDLNRTQSVVL